MYSLRDTVIQKLRKILFAQTLLMLEHAYNIKTYQPTVSCANITVVYRCLNCHLLQSFQIYL